MQFGAIDGVDAYVSLEYRYALPLGEQHFKPLLWFMSATSEFATRLLPS
jgi:hypothetical protein